MSRPRRRACQAFGFTLVELLVVISVIALLASLLMPALQTATAKAKETKCISNLRQLAQGFGTYRITYRDFMPSPSFPETLTSPIDTNYDGIPSDPPTDPPKPPFSWRGKLLPFIGNVSDNQDERYAIMKCPSVRSFTVPSTGKTCQSYYGINAYAGFFITKDGEALQDPTTKQFKYLHIEDFQSPSETFLVGENNAGHWAVRPTIPYSVKDDKGVPKDVPSIVDAAKSYARHSKRGCWVYADGHSASLTIPQSEQPRGPAAQPIKCYAYILAR